MKVVYLEEVESDLRDGRDFYDSQQPGIGDYFVHFILADAESLKKRSRYARFSTCAVILAGSARNFRPGIPA